MQEKSAAQHTAVPSDYLSCHPNHVIILGILLLDSIAARFSILDEHFLRTGLGTHANLSIHLRTQAS